MRTGYKTNLILSMPICNYEGDVIGVAQIINKTNETEEFTEHDVEVFQRYLTFCGIGIQNAQLFEVSVLEYRRNQVSYAKYASMTHFSLFATCVFADSTESGAQYLRGTKQSGMSSHENHDRGAGSPQMRTLRCVSPWSGLLRSGKSMMIFLFSDISINCSFIIYLRVFEMKYSFNEPLHYTYSYQQTSQWFLITELFFPQIISFLNIYSDLHSFCATFFKLGFVQNQWLAR